uniref:ATP-binding protein n=1 Tax=Paenibacillus oryzisoli TaxID=1850517 RepID=UPI003D26F653
MTCLSYFRAFNCIVFGKNKVFLEISLNREKKLSQTSSNDDLGTAIFMLHRDFFLRFRHRQSAQLAPACDIRNDGSDCC